MPEKNFKSKVIHAAKWTLVAHVLAILVRFGSAVIVSRLLPPAMFGIMAVGYLVVTGISMFSDLGTSAGAFQNKRGQDPIFLNVTWVVSILRGVLISFLLILLSLLIRQNWVVALFPVGSVYADPVIPDMLLVISIVGVLTGFESTKIIYSKIKMDAPRLSKLELIIQIFSVVFVIAYAIFSPTIWALVWGWVFSALLRTILSHTYLIGPPNRYHFDKLIIKDIFHFGKFAFVSSSVSFLLMSSDKILLSGMLGPESMGLYVIALGLVQAVSAAFYALADRVVLPVLADVSKLRPFDLKGVLYKFRIRFDIVLLTVAGMLIYLGEDIIKFVYDKRYQQAGWILSILSITLVGIRYELVDRMLLAIGKIQSLMFLNIIRLIVMYFGIYFGYTFFSTNGALFAVAICSVLNSLFVFYFQSKLGLVDFRKELLVLPVYGFGMVVGWISHTFLGYIRMAFV